MNNKPTLVLMAVLALLMAVTSLSVDIYLPAMPIMQRELSGNVELTITSFLIGFSLSQLIWGPISDSIGRRRPLFVGMFFFVIGSLGCALSKNIEQIIFWRVIQAFGACTGPMIARAIVRDLYAKNKAAHVLSTLTILMAIAPIIGPLIGGELIVVSNWHSIFWLITIIGIILFILIFYIPETHSIEKRNYNSITYIFKTYGLLLIQWSFMRYVLCITFFYVAAYTFIIGSPFVYITFYNVGEQYYGWLFSINIIGLISISLVNRHLVTRYNLDLLLKVATSISFIVLIMLVLLLNCKIGGIYSVIICVFVFFSMNGIIAACAIASALDQVNNKITGFASALIGALQYGSGIISSLFLVWFYNNSPLSMVTIMLIFAGLSTLMIFLPSTKDNVLWMNSEKN